MRPMLFLCVHFECNQLCKAPRVRPRKGDFVPWYNIPLAYNSPEEKSSLVLPKWYEEFGFQNEL
jgi:hypothetical protein